MKITRKIFMNKTNGQGSITLPKKVIEQLKKNHNNKRYPKKISFEILNAKPISKIR